MMQTLSERVRVSVSRGVNERTRFYASIDLEDEQVLGPSASTDSINLLEESSGGKRLPPSYRCFLALHDGWAMVDGGCDLLSIKQMLSGPVAERVRKWQAAMLKEGQAALASGLVIGYSAISQKRIVLDLARRDEDNECVLIQWDSDEWIEYPSFIGWLEATAREFGELADSPADPDAN
jgi:hypothetical protein